MGDTVWFVLWPSARWLCTSIDFGVRQSTSVFACIFVLEPVGDVLGSPAQVWCVVLLTPSQAIARLQARRAVQGLVDLVQAYRNVVNSPLRRRGGIAVPVGLCY